MSKPTVADSQLTRRKFKKTLTWNKTQKKLLLQLCKLHKAYKPTYRSFPSKWKLVANDLSKTLWFFGCGTDYWMDYMNSYHQFREETLSKFNIHYLDCTLEELRSKLKYQSTINDFDKIILELEVMRLQDGKNPMESARIKWKQSIYLNFETFMILSILLALAEIILIAFPPTYTLMTTQYGVLSTSLAFFIYGILMTRYYFPVDYDVVESFSYYLLATLFHRFFSPNGYRNLLINVEKWKHCLDVGTLFEIICYILGYIGLIYNDYGIASLRVFRILRLLTYLRYIDDQYSKVLSYNLAPRFISLTKIGHVLSNYLQRLSDEFFTQNTLGGWLLIVIFLFNSYVLSVIFSHNFGDIMTSHGQICYDNTDCFLTMLRIATYNDVGFEYVHGIISENQPGYILLIIIYMIFNGVILFNGLIGIYSRVFVYEPSTNITSLSTTTTTSHDNDNTNNTTNSIDLMNKTRNSFEIDTSTKTKIMELQKSINRLNQFFEQSKFLIHSNRETMNGSSHLGSGVGIGGENHELGDDLSSRKKDTYFTYNHHHHHNSNVNNIHQTSGKLNSTYQVDMNQITSNKTESTDTHTSLTSSMPNSPPSIQNPILTAATGGDDMSQISASSVHQKYVYNSNFKDKDIPVKVTMNNTNTGNSNSNSNSNKSPFYMSRIKEEHTPPFVTTQSRIQSVIDNANAITDPDDDLESIFVTSGNTRNNRFDSVTDHTLIDSFVPSDPSTPAPAEKKGSLFHLPHPHSHPLNIHKSQDSFNTDEDKEDKDKEEDNDNDDDDDDVTNVSNTRRLYKHDLLK